MNPRWILTLSLIVLAAPLRAEEPAASFNSLYGDELRHVTATTATKDDLMLAARFLRIARHPDTPPEHLTPLCEKTCELAVKDPAGYPMAIAAMRLLAAKVPSRQIQALQWIAAVQQRQYALARGEEKSKAADGLLEVYRETAQAQEATGDLDGAAATLRQALLLAANARSDAKAAFQAQLADMVARRQTAKQIAALKAKLDANPADAAARKELLRFYLVEMDDPAEAAKLVDESLDPPTRKYVPAAARGLDAAPELACPELGDWYRGLVSLAATPSTKAAVLHRAQGYYERFLALHPSADLQRDVVALALQKVDADLTALGPAAKPKTRRLLIMTLAKGAAHQSTPVAVKAFVEAGQKSRAFEATVSEDPAVFSKASLSKFDAVCLLNVVGEICADEGSRQALLDFVRSGKGLAVIHRATSANATWPAYAEMIGGAYVRSLPRGFVFKLEDPTSPLNASFGGKGLESGDELYTFKEPYSRELVHVLLSVDVAHSAALADRRADHPGGDYPVSWIRSYGQGRVFCCVLGHAESNFTNPAILGHMLAGIRFALGEVQADTTPSAKLAPRASREPTPGQ